MSDGRVKRHWRFYVTRSGRKVISKFIDDLVDDDAAEVHAAIKDVRDAGLRAARHLRGEIYEVRADGRNNSYRILFSNEGKKGRVLLALNAIEKRTQKTPPDELRLAERRLSDWRGRSTRR